MPSLTLYTPSCNPTEPSNQNRMSDASARRTRPVPRQPRTRSRGSRPQGVRNRAKRIGAAGDPKRGGPPSGANAGRAPRPAHGGRTRETGKAGLGVWRSPAFHLVCAHVREADSTRARPSRCGASRQAAAAARRPGRPEVRFRSVPRIG